MWASCEIEIDVLRFESDRFDMHLIPASRHFKPRLATLIG
jgi:hypothetical protein